MCSDGEVAKDNAQKAHQHWKNWVNQDYVDTHSIVPYVSTVGISSSHDADILDGFVCNDKSGNYVFCNNSEYYIYSIENSKKPFSRTIFISTC